MSATPVNYFSWSSRKQNVLLWFKDNSEFRDRLTRLNHLTRLFSFQMNLRLLPATFCTTFVLVCLLKTSGLPGLSFLFLNLTFFIFGLAGITPVYLQIKILNATDWIQNCPYWNLFLTSFIDYLRRRKDQGDLILNWNWNYLSRFRKYVS